MMDLAPSSPLRPLYLSEQRNATDGPIPPHHVLAPVPGTTMTSYLPHWNPVSVPSSSSSSSTPSASASISASTASGSVHNGTVQRDPSEDATPPLDSCSPFDGSRAPWTQTSSGSLHNATYHAIGAVRTGFRNPWPSSAKPTLAQVWAGLEWGEDRDECIDLALSLADELEIDDEEEQRFATAAPSTPYRDDEHDGGMASEPGQDGTASPPLPFPQQRDSRSSSGLFSTASVPLLNQARLTAVRHASAASKLLKTVCPDFSFDPSAQKAKVTWLGHAGVLLQLAPLDRTDPLAQPVRILFDPIFSLRCSPTQVAGPYRSYPSPCTIDALPPIDVVLISHNHYDHLDFDTIAALWRRHRETVRFVVPLGNRDWFLAPGSTDRDGLPFDVPPERVTELDWWESLHLSPSPTSACKLELTCTPAQHGSGRYGLDANVALWSSWYLTVLPSRHRIFFAGDTGFQLHPSASFPPTPSTAASLPLSPTEIADPSTPHPACPAFAEIRRRKGRPHISLLPVSVGATLSFLRSYLPLPDAVSPLPRVSLGLTGANHATPWDAVRMFRILTGSDSGPDGDGNDPDGVEGEHGEGGSDTHIAVAIHWGTFVSGPTEILKTVGNTLWACKAQGVGFGKGADRLAERTGARPDQQRGKFIVLDHGESVVQ